MKYSRLTLFLLLTLPLSLLAASPPCSIQPTSDWQREAAAARQEGVPLLVLFTADDCGFCERLKHDVLQPLVRQGKLLDQAHLVEFNIDAHGKVVDFDGERIRSGMFLSRYQVFATPTILLLDYDGEPLTSPIIGYNNAGEYPPYLDEALSASRMALKEHGSATEQHN